MQLIKSYLEGQLKISPAQMPKHKGSLKSQIIFDQGKKNSITGLEK